MRWFFRIIFALYGSPVCTSPGGPNWVQIFYSFGFLTLCTVPYGWSRFLSRFFDPSSAKVLPIDRLPLIGTINGYEIFAVILINYYHTFVLIRRHKIFRQIFNGGRILECLGAWDAILVSFCLIIFSVNFITQVTVFSQLRFISYCFVCAINHLIAFQYCAVLKHHASEISCLTRMLKTHYARAQSTRMLTSCILKYWDTLRTMQVSSDEFSYQILVVFAGLVIDVIYLISYTLILAEWNMVQGFQLVYFIYLVIIRITIIIYFSGHCQSVTRASEDFHITVFGLIRANSFHCNNNVKLILFLRMKRLPRLTAFGFYDYGCPLVITATSTAATYLVVLLQLS